MKLRVFVIFIIMMIYLPLQAQIKSIKMNNFEVSNIKDSLMLNLYKMFEYFKKNHIDSFTIHSDKEFFVCYSTPNLASDETETVMSLIRYDSTIIEMFIYWGYNSKISKRIIIKKEEYDEFLTLLKLIPNAEFFRQEGNAIKHETQFLFLKREKNENIFGIFCLNTLPQSSEDENYPTEKTIKAILRVFMLID